MRQAGRVVAGVLAAVEQELKPGVTTARLDAMAEDYIRKAGAKPSFKGYRGFPASICVSIDSEVVHGIPGKRVIEEGQVVSIDAGAIWKGYHGDGARTFYVGTPPAEVAGLLATTRLALMAGIAAAVPGAAYRRRLRARSRTWRWTAGAGSSGRTSGTASALRCTRTCRCPTTGRTIDGIELKPGICMAIEPMLTLGERRRADAERRLDRDHPGRVAGGSLRAHHRRHGQRSRDLTTV